MRTAEINRTTAETAITLRLCLDGTGASQVQSGVGFLDHMLTLFAKHSRFDLTLTCSGDTKVDDHHSVEDIGIVLGQALNHALGDRKGIRRFASACIPMDEALCFAALDFSNRPFLVFDAQMPQSRMGDYESCLTEEFLRAFAFNSGLTLHMKCRYGSNAHHITEALFKALGVAIKEAVTVTGTGVTSTKGVL